MRIRVCGMEVRVCVTLSSLRSAFRRLSICLPDESDAGDRSILFSAYGDSLEIVAGRTFESIAASVVNPGRADVPYNVITSFAAFRGHCVSTATEH